jgi:hypothetical protein
MSWPVAPMCSGPERLPRLLSALPLLLLRVQVAVLLLSLDSAVSAG